MFITRDTVRSYLDFATTFFFALPAKPFRTFFFLIISSKLNFSISIADDTCGNNNNLRMEFFLLQFVCLLFGMHFCILNQNKNRPLLLSYQAVLWRIAHVDDVTNRTVAGSQTDRAWHLVWHCFVSQYFVVRWRYLPNTGKNVWHVCVHLFILYA